MMPHTQQGSQANALAGERLGATGRPFLEVQTTYWNTLASGVADPVPLDHWVDERDRPVDRRMFAEVAAFLRRIPG